MVSGPVTLVGGTGFIGRRLACHLTGSGLRVRIVAREPSSATFPNSDHSIELVSGDIVSPGTVRRAVEGSRAIVYLAGTTAARSEKEFFDIHCNAPAAVAVAAAAERVASVVYFSAMGVSRAAPSLADRSKAEGESAVRNAFPGATIVRPSLVFGRDDHFFGRLLPLLRRSPVMPLIGGGITRFEPMHVDDLTQAVVRILDSDLARGRDYDLGGDVVLSLRSIVEALCAALNRKRLLINVPFGLAEAIARASSRLMPSAPLTVDQVRLLRSDKVHRAGSGRPADLGLEPQAIEGFIARLCTSQ